jgi:hypothetical protein
MKLEGMFFDKPAALLAEINKIFGDICKTEWINVFDEEKDRLKRCIHAEGEYLSNESSDVDCFFTVKQCDRVPGLNVPLVEGGNSRFHGKYRMTRIFLLLLMSLAGKHL